eukprot:6175897-Pleurochrysis_carterae.AAC.2
MSKGLCSGHLLYAPIGRSASLNVRTHVRMSRAIVHALARNVHVRTVNPGAPERICAASGQASALVTYRMRVLRPVRTSTHKRACARNCACAYQRWSTALAWGERY